MAAKRAKRMYRISGAAAVSQKHAHYQRELEMLAHDCEEHVELLKSDTPGKEKYIVEHLEKRLEKIYNAAFPKED